MTRKNKKVDDFLQFTFAPVSFINLTSDYLHANVKLSCRCIDKEKEDFSKLTFMASTKKT